MSAKRQERAQIDDMWPTDEIIRIREELADQMRALEDLAAMAKLYGCDITHPATDAQEAVQWTYLAYLGAIKEANGAAMSIGRISSFLDIFIERDLNEGTLDEAGAQELWDQLVQKLRIVRFLRTPEYDALFSGDPYWATECSSASQREYWPRPKQMGLHTAIETSGFLGDRVDEKYLAAASISCAARHQKRISGNLLNLDRPGFGADAALRRAVGRNRQAGMGALHVGAGTYRRPRERSRKLSGSSPR